VRLWSQRPRRRHLSENQRPQTKVRRRLMRMLNTMNAVDRIPLNTQLSTFNCCRRFSLILVTSDFLLIAVSSDTRNVKADQRVCPAESSLSRFRRMRRRRHARFGITDSTISKVTTGLNSIEIVRNPLCQWEFNYVNHGD
jgi:hypothetical protein